MKIETERLILREMTEDDFDALYRILGDADTMRIIAPYSGVLKPFDWETGEVIGDCGLTMQLIDGQIKPEIGYHIRADKQRNGYAREAAIAVRDWTFCNTPFQIIYSYMKSSNEPSIKTAISYGCRPVDEFADEINGITTVLAVSRDAWMSTGLRKKK